MKVNNWRQTWMLKLGNLISGNWEWAGFRMSLSEANSSSITMMSWETNSILPVKSSKDLTTFFEINLMKSNNGKSDAQTNKVKSQGIRTFRMISIPMSPRSIIWRLKTIGSMEFWSPGSVKFKIGRIDITPSKSPSIITPSSKKKRKILRIKWIIRSKLTKKWNLSFLSFKTTLTHIVKTKINTKILSEQTKDSKNKLKDSTMYWKIAQTSWTILESGTPKLKAL